MKMLTVALLSGILGFALIADTSDARRFGGGKSFGRSAPTAQPQAPTQRQAAQPQRNANQAAAPARSGASRWLGPLAGLAAGGLLAALFFGGAFEGLQIFDILIFAALLFGGIWLFKSLRRNSAGAAPAMQRQAYAGAGNANGYGDTPKSATQPTSASFETPAIGSGLTGERPSANAVAYRPDWFNEQEFLTAAKTHFVRLQAAWDVGDMKDIRDYTTPQLFADLTVERQSYNGEQQFTEVVELNATLDNLVREDNKLVASVRYDGTIREARDADAKAFTETWHIERALDQDNANWHVAGIQQHNADA